jgi:hypothetical protein
MWIADRPVSVYLSPLEVPVYDSVKSVLVPWLGQFEGNLPYMYLDVKGRVATGVGTDINSPAAARALAWRWKDGHLASADEVTREWASVNAMQGHRLEGGGSITWIQRAQLLVDPQSLAVYTAKLLASYEAVLRLPSFIGPAYDSLPGVCQLARLRTAYADGAWARWPRLDAALAVGNWQTAANESQPGDIMVQNVNYRRSYRAVRALYLLADAYPGSELPDPLPDGRSDTPTLPDAA